VANGVQEKVAGLEIAVNDAPLMQVLHTLEELASPVADFVLVQGAMHAEGTVGAKLHQ